MNNNIWDEADTQRLIEMRSEGVCYKDIADVLGRSEKSCVHKMVRVRESMGLKAVRPRKRSRPIMNRMSLCWLCRKAGHCKKPVAGWSIKTKDTADDGTLIIVKSCPEYIEESWVADMSEEERDRYYFNKEGV